MDWAAARVPLVCTPRATLAFLGFGEKPVDPCQSATAGHPGIRLLQANGSKDWIGTRGGPGTERHYRGASVVVTWNRL
jgi:hypothetical protein